MMMHFDMSKTKQVSGMANKRNKCNYDETRSMSSVSSIGVNSSFDSSVFEEEYNGRNDKISLSQVSPTTVLKGDYKEHFNRPTTDSNNKYSTQIGLKSKAYISNEQGYCGDDDNDHNDTSFEMTDDEWTTQGNRTERTAQTGDTFYTGYTDTTGTTKLHKNGVSATLHRKLRRDNSWRDDQKPVPKSINTIRRPMSFDYGVDSAAAAMKQRELVAPSTLDRRTTSHQKKIYSTSKLKDNPAAQGFNDECSIADTIAENGDYYAGSGGFIGFFRNLFLCCNADGTV